MTLNEVTNMIAQTSLTPATKSLKNKVHAHPQCAPYTLIKIMHLCALPLLNKHTFANTHQAEMQTMLALQRKREEDEPLLKENPNRFVLFPIKYPKVFEMYKKEEVLTCADAFPYSPPFVHLYHPPDIYYADETDLFSHFC